MADWQYHRLWQEKKNIHTVGSLVDFISVPANQALSLSYHSVQDQSGNQ